MKIGLFLDLDGVITEKAVNLQFASMLKIEPELYKLEDDYACGIINNTEFNNRFIPIFRKAGFTETFAKQNFKNIQLSIHAEELLQFDSQNSYVVSSSPSYFVNQFAVKYNIPKENIICSEYSFDNDGYLHKCISPCGLDQKASFVDYKRKKYDLTVGIGDTPEQDAKFMSLCDIPILMGGVRRNYLSTTDLFSVNNVLKILKKNISLSENAPYECLNSIENLRRLSIGKDNIFIITPFKKDARFEVALETIKEEIASYGANAYLASDIVINEDLWVGVRSYMHFCNSAIALITAHEEITENCTTYRGDIYNPNVMTEVGYMLGQNKSVLLLKDDRVKLPTDWMGKLYSPINMQSPKKQIIEAVRTWYELQVKLKN